MTFELEAAEACRLNGSLIRPLKRFAGTTVHGVAAIGNPQRFFDLLRSWDMQVIEHAFPDHAVIDRGDLDFKDNFEILMTEKDAVKYGRKAPDNVWFIPVEPRFDSTQARPWLEQIESRFRKHAHD
jgi:tetraacyldisaccharide 4'-kinase